ncbi:hypothetical protein [Flavobacterium longum]|uniref:hypothetical protein n=1 Tax=Flavobacterium longum TaxID=1299340 RepID=UPI0039E7E22F
MTKLIFASSLVAVLCGMMRRFLFCFCLLAMAGCSAVHVSRTWRAPEVVPPKKVLVLAVLPTSEQALQANIESHLADDLNCIGYPAVAFRAVSPELIDRNNASATKAQLAAAGFSAVLVVTLLDAKVEKKTMPDELWCSQYNNYNRELNCYLVSLQQKTADVLNPKRRYLWESSLFGADLKLLYSIRLCPGRLEKAKSDRLESFHTIIADMVWQDVLPLPADENANLQDVTH